MNEETRPTAREAPSAESCPKWCIADHEHQGDETQRWHYSTCIELPLVELTRPHRVTGEASMDMALPFDVGLERPWGSSATYVLLGVGFEWARTFCVSLESAERLVEAMRDAIRLAHGSPED